MASIKKASEVLKTEPILFKLPILSKTIITGNFSSGNVSATFKLVYDFADPNSPQPSSFSLTTGAGVALYDLAATTYGTAVYDSSGASLVRQPVEGSGFTVAVRLDDTSTNPPLELKGYEMEFIPGDRR